MPVGNDFLKDKTVLISDRGNYAEVAMRLARDFGRVYYYCDWKSAYPKYDPYVIGDGIDTIYPNFHHTHSIWDVYNEIDLFYFPDLYDGDFQEWLRNQGKLVFGAGKGEHMELHRYDMKMLLDDLGLPVSPGIQIVGLDNLREFLQNNRNMWVKTDMLRGSMESFFHIRYELSKPRLDRFEHTLGIYKDRQIFLVEEPVEDSIDFAADMIVADGLYPAKTLAGVEQKNKSYIGVMADYYQLPKSIRRINDKLSETLRRYQYRCAFSPECRVTKSGKAYLTDPCCRHGHPPTSLQLEMIDNFSEMAWMTATGEKPEIFSTHKYGAMLVIKSEYAQKEPQAVYFPESIRDFVKIKNLCIQDGINYFIPDDHDMNEIGSVIGMGSSVNDAISMCAANAKLIEGDGIDIDIDSLQDAKKEIKTLPDYGINIF